MFLLLIVLLLLSCISGELNQFNCIEIIPGKLFKDNVVSSKDDSSYTDCITFCLDRDEIWLSASLQKTKCHCHDKHFIGTDGTADSSSTYFKLDKRTNSRNCYDIYMCYSKGNGVYNVSLDGTKDDFQIYCDMDNGGWSVIQSRFDGSLSFQKSYMEYKEGFGDVYGEYWLGLENIHTIVSSGNFEVRFDLEDWEGNTRYAVYSYFALADGNHNYQLNISGYIGNAGDAARTHDGMLFSAGMIDYDNWPTACVDRFGGGGFWYNACHNMNINGQYNNTANGEGINWGQWRGYYYSLKSVSMKIYQLVQILVQDKHSITYDSKRAIQVPSEEAGHVVKLKRKSTEPGYQYRKRRVTEMPSEEEIDNTNADDTAAITAMSI
ncbi:Ryncolin-2,Fibrinogen C domain-containing protein 1-A,Microfibril-associated glycoprotein 4,Ficolin-1-A,Ryncolin-1,Tenascin,Fibrinogen C domain-containing protein 1-B,Fibrinogen C domain-containing protein 1 [Mytilus coruscus]|uniref:Fibrinogen C-terminal domain-containing protein n=1 Tax=Mytilus coruscus TaxID=42192 RepID=A0A6J8CY77_MYTCO|nr:Ryncolin-2,Fibrinogen C domain-containing protein 1-A,Microfibril-associated glycoprotein 4,Ficolin-1-A,Ryncolin-1,Tenascin,Fibrinogen C domain-containing protein 1-B,Fibrinogen C domain-containing protein 1 [Mytilus coruscus]